RGAHLALSLERLSALCPQPVQRIGLSATQRPVEAVANFLVGGDGQMCRIVDDGHQRERDLRLEVTATPLEAIMSNEAWEEIYDRLAELADEHRTTVVFVNTRRLTERVSRHVAKRLGESVVAAHHGSMAKEARLDAEQRLKRGELRLLVATASLELGIDIGEVDLVCQLGSTHRISTFLQRVGRSGHGVGRTPKGRLFPLTRDDLVECVALLYAAQRGELDRLRLTTAPLDVLAQQLVATCACESWNEDALFALITRAQPYRALDRDAFNAVLRMLAEGYSTRRGRQGAYLHRDAVSATVKARDNARLVALTAGGAIPETADYTVVAEPEGLAVGTLDEDFAIESIPGDIFQLGNTSWQILRVESGKVRVADANGAPPTIPFWLGEAPARTEELSGIVNWIRTQIGALDPHLRQNHEPLRHSADTPDDSLAAIFDWAQTELRISGTVAEQLIHYLAAGARSLGCMPSQTTPVLERFFDESGGMQLVVHAPFGARLNRAWGLALRKRFCRNFNFELQAAATEDSIVLSLGETHSFALRDIASYLSANTVEDVLKQALVDAPMFTARWRWNANISLAVPRSRAGKKVPPPIQRMNAEDLLSVVFPDSIACAENLTGHREIPDHPLVNQTFQDALHDAMDVDVLKELLVKINESTVQLHCVDVTEPSAFSAEIIAARPYAYLDDAPLEERRTRAVRPPRHVDPHSARTLSQISEAALTRVRNEIRPRLNTVESVHDALLGAAFLTHSELTDTDPALLHELTRARRATPVQVPHATHPIWVAAERLALIEAAQPEAKPQFDVSIPPGYQTSVDGDSALEEIIRGRAHITGPFEAAHISTALGLPHASVNAAVQRLQAQGFLFAGEFSGTGRTEWCERRLLARMHQYSMSQRRREVEPVSSATFMRFLLAWHGIEQPREWKRSDSPRARRTTDQERLASTLAQLEAYEAPASAWESDILTTRLSHYDATWLDALCLSGRIGWLRLTPRESSTYGVGLLRSTPIAFTPRRRLAHWQRPPSESRTVCSPRAERVLECLTTGSQFLHDIAEDTGLLPAEVEKALAELVRLGQATADSFAGLRGLLPAESKRRANPGPFSPKRTEAATLEAAGRWSAIAPASSERSDVEYAARTLLRRYGVVFRALLERESAMPPWRELLFELRRLEASGDVRGGRFVTGYSGEQFALPEAVSQLQSARRWRPSGRT
ncbi:MAG: ATP-dependent DNA helicase, partial [Gammaproteobacteria bacterium]|nr:ATP-dependent DNA helicase [Gammaproteobacteria bacterium]